MLADAPGTSVCGAAVSEASRSSAPVAGASACGWSAIDNPVQEEGSDVGDLAGEGITRGGKLGGFSLLVSAWRSSFRIVTRSLRVPVLGPAAGV